MTRVITNNTQGHPNQVFISSGNSFDTWKEPIDIRHLNIDKVSNYSNARSKHINKMCSQRFKGPQPPEKERAEATIEVEAVKDAVDVHTNRWNVEEVTDTVIEEDTTSKE